WPRRAMAAGRVRIRSSAVLLCFEPVDDFQQFERLVDVDARRSSAVRSSTIGGCPEPTSWCDCDRCDSKTRMKRARHTASCWPRAFRSCSIGMSSSRGRSTCNVLSRYVRASMWFPTACRPRFSGRSSVRTSSAAFRSGTRSTATWPTWEVTSATASVLFIAAAAMRPRSCGNRSSSPTGKASTGCWSRATQTTPPQRRSSGSSVGSSKTYARTPMTGPNSATGSA
ncbi:MAG: PhnO protein, partial [uncultured Solirubrobacteraceae bacterium]